MSAWERARYIPWNRIPASGEDLEAQKERIFRELQRETIQDEIQSIERKPGVSNETIKAVVPFSGMILLRQAAFGGCIGSITGAVFGFMDGMRGVGESSVLKNASNQAKGRYLMQGTTRSATIFGVFFGGFHIVKYGIRVVANDPGEVAEIGLAGIVSVGGLMYKPAWRASMPYAVMLIFMDSVNVFLRTNPM